MKKLILALFILLSIIPIIGAKEGHLILLAVKETDDGFEGSTADLYLEIRPGTGRVFLDTFPLTKVDTQISTRFAKEIACDFLNEDCSEYDFIYTIKAESVIIAGPSAGGAAAVLTVALLADLELDESVSITGTINSGGLIGHVGGIKQKIDAGAQAGLKKILVPKGEKIVSSDTNSSESLMWDIINDTLKIIIENRTKKSQKEIDLEEYSKEKGVIIKEVITLNDAVFEFTGKRFQEDGKELVIDPKYAEIMKKLSISLCNRSNKLKKGIEDIQFEDNYSAVKESAINLTEKGKSAFDEGKFYSSASYCFGANVKYTFLVMLSENFSKEVIIKGTDMVRKSIGNIGKRIANKKIMTITDLESYVAIKERLLDSDYHVNLTLKNIGKNEEALYNLAYASERVYSALSWYEFFKNIGKNFDLNKEKIKQSCQNKISEAEERYQYVRLLFPAYLKGTKKEISYAYSYLANKEYELCLFKASIAKAQADIILNLIGLDENKTKELLDMKLEIVKKNIIKESKAGIFPIMAYSYYEYAYSLKESDLYSALLYAEYALELSNFNMYFGRVGKRLAVKIDQRAWIFILGIAIGAAPFLFFIKERKIKKRKKKKKFSSKIFYKGRRRGNG